MAHSKPEVVEAILACLLSNPSSSDEKVRRSAPDLPILPGEVRWFRYCIYRVIRLLEEGATDWNIPREKLYTKTEKRELVLITAVIWAVMRYPQEHDALKAASVVKTSDTKGYALQMRCIFREVKNFSVEKRERYRNKLCEQISPKQVSGMEGQICLLERLAKPTG